MKHTKPIYRSRNLFFFLFLFYIFSFTTASYGQQTSCPNDFDCDGIIDALDVDDDNDGIYDHVESPNCFYLDKAILQSGDRRVFLNVNTTLPYTAGSPDLLVDGSASGITIPRGTALTDLEIFRLHSSFLGGIEYSSFTLALNASAFFTSTSRVVLQGSQDGVNWSDLSGILTPATTTTVTFIVTKNQGTYRIYRLLGTAGVTGSTVKTMNEITGTVGAYMPSLFPKVICDGEDIDNDGLPNHQDLDADGDGGSDVLETGFSDGDKDGMLGLSPVTVDQFGAVTSAVGYILPNVYYKTTTVNVVVDTDGDGILDVYDLDDDNDGIFDHFESPSCFNLVTDFETGNRRELLSVSTDLVYTTGSVDLLIDGSTTTGILMPVATPVAGKEIVKLSTRLISGIEFSAIVLHFNASSFNNVKVILQGNKDGLEWVDLTQEITPINSSVIAIPVTKNQGSYGMYRLLGTAGIVNGNRSITEITTIVGAHIASSLLPKLNCTDEDVDQDGIPNHKDLDTDGNGEFDVIEAGFIDEDMDGLLGTSPVTVDQFGAVISNRGNVVPLDFYKSATIDLRKDTDGDGVLDLFDVDDDNDGIFDHIESSNCFYINKTSFEFGDRRKVLDSSTTLPYTTGTMDLLVDGLTTDSSGISIPAATPLSGLELIRLTTKLAQGIEYIVVKVSFNTTAFFTASSRVQLQASQDGITWTDLGDVFTPEVAASTVTMTVTKNLDSYRIYRILGVGGTSGSALRIMTEVTGTVGEYMPSLYPKLNCMGEDVDNDGKPNHQDLNSDGDTCNDVIEAGFLDLDRDGILGTSPVTVDQYGKVTSEIGYIVPNNLYYLDATKNVCTGEGIPIDEDARCVDMDNMSNDAKLVQGGFHATIARTKSGFSIFGEGARPVAAGGNLLRPTEIVPAKGFTYEGTIIDATLGGRTNSQFFLLATGGLYTWGTVGFSIPASWTSDRSFRKINLPNGISPSAIKFISASTRNLVLLTKSGDVYIVAGSVDSDFGAYGDGSTVYDEFWHKSNISNVVSIRVNSGGQALALTVSGELFIWGRGVIVGDGTAAQDLLLPTKIALPSGVTKVKMIASSTSAIFVLGDDKRVYGTGINELGQLGIGNTTTQLSWQTVKNPLGTAYLENIKFINATIHDALDGAVGAIDESGIAYLWGNNSALKLGVGGVASISLPRVPDGIRPGFHNALYIEPGGHVTPIVDKKTGKFGYVGHKINGSMGDGVVEGSFVSAYNFTNTPFIDFCGLTFGEIKTTRIMVNPMNINSRPIR